MTHAFDDQCNLKVSGMELELIHAPGESPDQIVVWLPKEKILLAADNIYKAFPNLYAIRGTRTRYVDKHYD